MNVLINQVSKILQDTQSQAEVTAIKKQAQTRLEELLKENPEESKALRLHTKQNIYPTIAMYEAMCNQGMKSEEAIMVLDEFYQATGRKMAIALRLILKIPGLYHRIPAIFTKCVLKMFGTDAGFRYRFPETPSEGEMRFDMLECPYNEICLKYACPELCRVFCDSDDASYGNMHPKLEWGRTKTLGKGGSCCDFRLTDLSRSDISEKGRLRGSAAGKIRMTRQIVAAECSIRDFLDAQLPEDDSRIIYRHQLRQYKLLAQQLQKSGKNRSQRKALYTILAPIALYQALQSIRSYSSRAYELTEKYMLTVVAPAAHEKLAQMEKIPGFFILYKKLFRLYVKHSPLWKSADKETRDRLFLKITGCTWKDACAENGCPELAPVFCECDKVIYSGLKKLGFHCTKTLGCGDSCCNFCFYRKGE